MEAVDYNAIFFANTHALAKMAKVLGKEDDARDWEEVAERNVQAIRMKMWDSEAGFFWDLAGQFEAQIRVPTAATFIPLFAKAADASQVARLVEHLISPRFWSRYPVPTVSMDHPLFAPNRYWRGNTWLNVNWFIVHGLRAYGYTDLAAEIAQRSVELVECGGFREYFHPLTGEGLGSNSHSWSGLVLDMV
jgi:putative isomerase